VVKILQPKLMNSPKLFANCAAGLIREGLFLASIDHPHVLKVHAWTSPNAWMDFAALNKKEGDLFDGYILVLERLKGGSLKGWIRKWQDEHEEEQRAIAAVAAMEAAEARKALEALEKSQRKKLGMPKRLSLTNTSLESFSNPNFSVSSLLNSQTSLRHTVLKSNFEDEAATTPLLGSPNSPASTSASAGSSFDSSERKFPYTSKWPTTRLADRTSLLLQLSDTVKYLHKHRILHRDLKPDNLGVTFVDPHGNGSKQKQYPSNLSLKIFDFDIARLVPEDPNEAKELDLSGTTKKKKRRNSSGSAHSLDPDLLNTSTNRAGRSVSLSRSLTGEERSNHSTHRRTKEKYRGRRPRPGEPAKASPPPEEVAPTPEEKVSDALFEMTGKMGSPRYMAPEVARGEPYNLRTEVYTVCLLVHEVLTLQKPYDELAPEDHGKLVHFDKPGYRPPIFSEWMWPTELEGLLRTGFGEITQRPSMREVHSIMKKALPKICPELVQTKPETESIENHSEIQSEMAQNPPKETKKKVRSLFHRTPKANRSKRGGRSSSLTPTAPNSDYSVSNHESLALNVVQ